MARARPEMLNHQLALRYYRLLQIVQYFRGPEDDLEKDDMKDNIPAWFESKIISSPKCLEENYDSDTDIHFLVKEDCIDGKIVKTRKDLSKEDFATLKRANDMIAKFEPFNINKNIIQLNVALELKKTVFEKLFGHPHFVDIGHICFMRGHLYIDSDYYDGILHICSHIRILIMNQHQDDQEIQHEVFQNLELVLYLYFERKEDFGEFTNDIFDGIYITCKKVIEKMIQPYNSIHGGIKFKVYLCRADYHTSQHILDYGGAIKVYKEALSYLESIKKYLNAKDFKESRIVCYFHIGYYLKKQHLYQEAMEYLKKIVNLPQVSTLRLVFVYLRIGEILEVQGKNQEALSNFNKSLQCVMTQNSKIAVMKFQQFKVQIILIGFGLKNQMSKKKICFYMKQILASINEDYDNFIYGIKGINLKKLFIFFNVLPMISKVLLIQCKTCGRCQNCQAFTENSRSKHIKMKKKHWRLLKNSIFINHSMQDKNIFSMPHTPIL